MWVLFFYGDCATTFTPPSVLMCIISSLLCLIFFIYPERQLSYFGQSVHQWPHICCPLLSFFPQNFLLYFHPAPPLSKESVVMWFCSYMALWLTMLYKKKLVEWISSFANLLLNLLLSFAGSPRNNTSAGSIYTRFKMKRQSLRFKLLVIGSLIPHIGYCSASCN